jgi:hypothetical protein
MLSFLPLWASRLPLKPRRLRRLDKLTLLSLQHRLSCQDWHLCSVCNLVCSRSLLTKDILVRSILRSYCRCVVGPLSGQFGSTGYVTRLCEHRLLLCHPMVNVLSLHLAGVVKSGRLGCGGYISCRNSIFPKCGTKTCL